MQVKIRFGHQAERIRFAACTLFLGAMASFCPPAACSATMYVSSGSQSIIQVSSSGR